MHKVVFKSIGHLALGKIHTGPGIIPLNAFLILWYFMAVTIVWSIGESTYNEKVIVAP